MCQGVRVSLFAHLFASGRRGSSWRDIVVPCMAPAGAHVALLLSFVLVLPARPMDDSVPQTVTYLDIAPPPTAESPRAALPPQPPVVRLGLRIPAVLPEVSQPGMLAGFQELLEPARVAGLPPVDMAQQAVSELDFKGRGVAGGVAGGVKPEEVAEPTDAPPFSTTAVYEAAAVEELPELLNRAELPGILRDLHPSLLRQAGVGGAVSVEFVVTPAGRVDRRSVRVLHSPHPQLSAATRAALERFRFRPGRMVVTGVDYRVAVLVRMTIEWTVNSRGLR